jgi:hypothetical protein
VGAYPLVVQTSVALFVAETLSLACAKPRKIMHRCLFNRHKNEFSFLNFILVVAAKRAPISKSAMPTLGFQSDGRQSRPKEYPHVT